MYIYIPATGMERVTHKGKMFQEEDKGDQNALFDVAGFSRGREQGTGEPQKSSTIEKAALVSQGPA